ncbi:hypothetical protein K435DRAFT_866922 [Dendrothele bispora CBS 962.96]|uniref:Uncharacterized protein n=1 Tax=Dendrothele bispora (strain CBS 962.96) TaxID=1314807 RepID=A0A4S8LGC6_DENBC|nr:hypothetical protein K435DRAFT_866922 [Dendrothele bispora CBS 962.96]
MTSLLSDLSSFPLTYALPSPACLHFHWCLPHSGPLSLLCTFAPQYDAIPDSFTSPSGKKKFQFIFIGGIGGLLIEYSFGLHLTMFLSLLIPNSFPSISPPSEKSFIAIWLLPSLLTTFLGSQHKHAALAFAGVTDGVIILPSFITPILTLPRPSPSGTTPTSLPSVSHLFYRLIQIGPIDSAISPYTGLGKCLVEVLVEVEFGVVREQKNDRWSASKSSSNSTSDEEMDLSRAPQTPCQPIQGLSTDTTSSFTFSPILTQSTR